MMDPYAEYRAGSLEPWTAEVLIAFVKAKKPHIVIETGTFEARTTVKLLAAMQGYVEEH